jgi:hypothetical protein
VLVSELKFRRRTKLTSTGPKPGELPMGRACVERARPEPVNVAKFWDDLWVGVISQANSVIAGSLRNAS